MKSPDLYVRIADTFEKHSKGLMFVRDLPYNEGMLFIFGSSRPLSFWGENTYIPLDIAFIDKEGIIQNIDHIMPFDRSSVKSSSPCKYALEANAGFFEDFKIKPGYKMNILDKEFLDKKAVSFERPIKTAQILNEERNIDLEERTPSDRYESLPQISPEDIGEYLADNDVAEDPSTLDVDDEMPSQYPEPYLDPVKDTLEDEVIPQFDNVFEAVDNFAKPTFDNNFEGHVMRIQYTTKHGTPIARDIEPHGTFHADTTSNKILVSYDRTVGDIRAFIMSNIQAFAFTKEKFEPKFRIKH